MYSINPWGFLALSFFDFFFSFSVKLIYNSDLLTKISLHLLHPLNFTCYFSFLPNIAPNFDKFVNVSQCSFSGLVSFQCFEKVCLVTMELNVVLLSLSLFNTFFQFNFLVYQLILNSFIVKPLLLSNSQTIGRSFFTHSRCFIISFSFFAAFLLTFFLKSSYFVLTIHCCSSFISLFNFRSRLFSSLASFFAVLCHLGCLIPNLNAIDFPVE